MNDREWMTFFGLMRKAINLPGLTTDEKRDKVIEKAKKDGDDPVLEEFAAMFGGDASEEVI